MNSTTSAISADPYADLAADLRCAIDPRSIAVVGASDNVDKLGGRCLQYPPCPGQLRRLGRKGGLHRRHLGGVDAQLAAKAHAPAACRVVGQDARAGRPDGAGRRAQLVGGGHASSSSTLPTVRARRPPRNGSRPGLRSSSTCEFCTGSLPWTSGRGEARQPACNTLAGRRNEVRCCGALTRGAARRHSRKWLPFATLRRWHRRCSLSSPKPATPLAPLRSTTP